MKLFDVEQDKKENLDKLEQMFANKTEGKEEWMGSEGSRASKDVRSDEVKKLLRYGFLGRGDVSENDLTQRGIISDAEILYRDLAIEDPMAAKTLEESLPVEFDDEMVKQALDYYFRGEVNDEDLKSVFAVLNELAPDMDATEFKKRDINTERLKFRENDRLLDELGREIYNSLDGTARVFFEYSRRPGAERPKGFHVNWENKADPTKKTLSDPNKQVKEIYNGFKQDLVNKEEFIDNLSGLVEERRAIMNYINSDTWVKAIDIAYRFKLDERDEIVREFRNNLDEVESYLEKMDDKGSRDRELLNKVKDRTEFYESFNNSDYDSELLMDCIEGLNRSIGNMELYLGQELSDVDSYKERITKTESSQLRPETEKKRYLVPFWGE